MKDLELEDELYATRVVIDINRLANSNIKQIVMPLHRFIEWKCLDKNNNYLGKSEVFDSCLLPDDAEKAKTLNRLSLSNIWNLLDEDFKNTHNFEDFVD